jgi:hypothetical protein
VREDNAGLLDWVLAGAAVAVAAFLMALGATPPDTREVTVVDVRNLEEPAKLHDAELALPDEVRAAIGVRVDAEASPDAVVAAVRDVVVKDRPWSTRLRLLAAAVAASFGAREAALEQLAEVTVEGDRVATSTRIARDALRDLARGRPLADREALVTLLRAFDASPWLVERVRARDLLNAGAADPAAAALAQARQHATDYVGRTLALALVVGSLWLVGLLLLFAWPFIRRSLHNAGRRGIRDVLDPFEPGRARRVMATWFLAYVAVSVLMGGLFGAFGVSTQTDLLHMAATTLISGGIAVTCIEQMGRRLGAQPGHAVPLVVPLRLRVADVEGGWLGLPLWVLTGLAVAAFLTVAALFVNAQLLDDATQPQQGLELLARVRTGPELAVLLASVALLAPIFEEILFRGYLYQTLRHAIGPTLAMLASGALFGLVHLEAGNALPLGVLGVALAFSFEVSGSLLVPIAIHALWNVSSVIGTLITVAG